MAPHVPDVEGLDVPLAPIHLATLSVGSHVRVRKDWWLHEVDILVDKLLGHRLLVVGPLCDWYLLLTLLRELYTVLFQI